MKAPLNHYRLVRRTPNRHHVSARIPSLNASDTTTGENQMFLCLARPAGRYVEPRTAIALEFEKAELSADIGHPFEHHLCGVGC